jgi:hypothetical protein
MLSDGRVSAKRDRAMRGKFARVGKSSDLAIILAAQEPEKTICGLQSLANQEGSRSGRLFITTSTERGDSGFQRSATAEFSRLVTLLMAQETALESS